MASSGTAAELDGEDDAQDRPDDELGHGEEHYGACGDGCVQRVSTPARGEHAHHEGDRHREHQGVQGKQQRVAEPVEHERSHRLLQRGRGAPIAGDEP